MGDVYGWTDGWMDVLADFDVLFILWQRYELSRGRGELWRVRTEARHLYLHYTTFRTNLLCLAEMEILVSVLLSSRVSLWPDVAWW